MGSNSELFKIGPSGRRTGRGPVNEFKFEDVEGRSWAAWLAWGGTTELLVSSNIFGSGPIDGFISEDIEGGSAAESLVSTGTKGSDTEPRLFRMCGGTMRVMRRRGLISFAKRGAVVDSPLA